MLPLDLCPMLEMTLEQLVNKTEKNWGYLQVHKRGEFYILSILGRGDNLLRFQSNETAHSYKVFWYKRPKPSVLVRSKTIKPSAKQQLLASESKAASSKSQKSYQVSYQVAANPVETSINRRIAQSIKRNIIQNLKSPDSSGLVSLVQE
ncbi:MAG: hypothetical protein HC825_10960 [Oscillatoriales cyanobacterium RM1_1_9]|nr:hypothetical protein [Oscillatoriales cyanobacterium SM2_3_0]NJO46507.1 hypothetical protein [Oscillatoriales cyanobacterium RM2_1_1]NJO72047.1 hypothetical protein [Oscillatoriales cyanobacterium RM1_1_9]